MELNPELYNRFLQQMFDLWVLPEVQRRRAGGAISADFDLRAAQVLFHPEGRPPEVRLNSEVQYVAKARLKPGIVKANDEPIYAHEVDGVDSIKLPPGVHSDSGHATTIRIGETWALVFDFVYNKGLATNHLVVARQFLAASEFSRSQHAMAASIDNLFSACEIAARATLLTVPDKEFRKKGTHNSVRSKFNMWARLGNARPEHVSVLNKLSALRDRVRYRCEPFQTTHDDLDAMFVAVRETPAATQTPPLVATPNSPTLRPCNGA